MRSLALLLLCAALALSGAEARKLRGSNLNPNFPLFWASTRVLDPRSLWGLYTGASSTNSAITTQPAASGGRAVPLRGPAGRADAVALRRSPLERAFRPAAVYGEPLGPTEAVSMQLSDTTSNERFD